MKNILALLADVANGIFATLIVAALTGVEPSWHFIAGVLFAMSPDLDALRSGASTASASNPYDHREGLHYPILFVFAGITLVYLVPFWGWLFLLGSMFHFANDFYGTGWGVQILWPLTKRRYKFLGRRANLLKAILVEKGLWNILPHDERRLRLIVSWSPEEITEYIQKYGEDDWIRKYYLRLNWISGIEYTLFVLAVILMVSL